MVVGGVVFKYSCDFNLMCECVLGFEFLLYMLVFDL